MLRTRLVIFASTIALTAAAVPMAFPIAAHASLDKCHFDLAKDREDAGDAVFSASHSFTRDVTSFIDVKAGSISEIVSDYRDSRRDLASDFLQGRRDILQARAEAVFDMRNECGDLTARQVRREFAFYSRMRHQLRLAYRKAKLALHKAYVSEIQSCCAG